MPLTSTTGPCAYCIREAAEEIDPRTGEAIGIENVNVLDGTFQTARLCLHCIKRFCPRHASPVDFSDDCFVFLPFEAVGEDKVPLIDVEGVTHKGVRLIPTGAGYKTLPKAIFDMNDGELDAFITEKAAQIHLVEKQRDYLKIAQSTARLEKDERIENHNRALRAVKMLYPKANAAIKITGNAKDKSPAGAKGASNGKATFNLADFMKFAQEQLKTGLIQQAIAKPFIDHKPYEKAFAPTHAKTINLTPEEIADSARNAEIEAILDGGEAIK